MNEEPQRSSMAATNAIAVFCWILGVSGKCFAINIENSHVVYHLKKAIVEENPVAFAGVDAFELSLWKVCGFLHFDQVSYIPPPQGISPDRQEPQGESDTNPVPRQRRVVRGGYIVGNISSSWTRSENSPHSHTISARW